MTRLSGESSVLVAAALANMNLISSGGGH